MSIYLDPDIWGPHYWFVLFSIAYSYPEKPNKLTKKKYYEFIQNLPLFLPHEKIGNDFISILDKYPVTPYLDSRMSFMKWIHFIHNKINVSLQKKQISFDEAVKQYEELYLPEPVIETNNYIFRRKYVWGSVIGILLILIYLVSRE
jgi:hypothetical protein